MENRLPALIYCPHCKADQESGILGSNKLDSITLGSVTSEGYVIIKRAAGKMTMVMADTYSLICNCGYYIRVNNGRIVENSLNNLHGSIIHG